VLPENSAWWRTAQWHMGATLEATGNRPDALAAYLKGYNPQSPNPVQRAIIEALYRKVNGSLEGLDAKIGAAASVSSNTGGTTGNATPAKAPETPPSTPVETPTQKPEETPSASPATSEPVETKPPASEQPKTKSTEQKPVQGTHPVRQP
jgi:hypothetical protein